VVVFGVTVGYSHKLLGGVPLALASDGWDVHIVSSLNEEWNWVPTPQIRHHNIPMKREIAPLADFLSFLRWVRILDQVRPNAVVIGTPKAALLGLAAAWLMRIPVRIYHLRGLRLDTATGLKRIILLGIERLCSGFSTRILSVSTSLSERYRAMGLAGRLSPIVLAKGSSHGVDIDRFAPLAREMRKQVRDDLGFDGNLPVIGFVGRFCADKGVELLLSTRRSLLDRGIDHQLLIVGPVEDSAPVLAGLESLGNCLHIGHTATPELYYGVMDLLLLPSRREGFPNAILEAAAMGVPCVSSDATGCVDAVIDGVTGFIAPLRTSRVFAERVAGLLSDEELATSFGSSARKRALEEFSQAKVEKAFVSFLNAQVHWSPNPVADEVNR